MAERIDDDGGVWIQGGTARIPMAGEPGGGPVVFDDTPPKLKEHLKREVNKDALAYGASQTAQLLNDHYPNFAEARKTMNLADGKGFTERSLKAYDADLLAAAKGAPNDQARQRFVDEAMDLRYALETRFAETESASKDMARRSDLGLKADALSRQAQSGSTGRTERPTIPTPCARWRWGLIPYWVFGVPKNLRPICARAS